MKENDLINYSNIFLYRKKDVDTVHETKVQAHHLVYICSGELELWENGRKTVVREGECVFIRRDNRISMNKYCSKKDHTYQSISLFFDRKFLLDFYKKLDSTEVPQEIKRSKVSVMKMPHRPDVVSLFESIKPYFDTDIQPQEEWLKLKLIEGLYTVLNTDRNVYASLFDFADPWKIDILGFMNENYMYDLSLEELANYTGRSLTTFKRDFKKVSSGTPQKWIIRKRLEVAHEMIVVQGKKVKDVIMDVGFKNMSHFSKIYKETYGTAPSVTY